MLGTIYGAGHSVRFEMGDGYKERLGRYISDVEESLASGSWFTTEFAKLDKKFMPGLVGSANLSKPGINLHYIENPTLISDKILESINIGVGSERYIVNMGDDGIHFAAFDYRLVDGKPSLLMFEPANFNFPSPVLLAFRVNSALEKIDSQDVKFSMLEMNIQKSSNECGIFSLALAKKLHKESDSVSELHRMNVAGNIPSAYDSFSSSAESDKLIPPSLYKHAQGRGRLAMYLESNRGSESVKVNKKGETLLDRQVQHLEEIEGKDVVNSIHQKRLVELNKLMGIIGD
ncbi:YopJ/AvrA family T3SS effector serine/threonine acetyltransferase [Burkholderia sp. DN3021]|uniref:YopJ/AvrA family T3SS effector serine/threonine acetyltransferase n=1 Tax=Burkholderia sp. DN3021 TaxID=3410137 RepID=UPI003C7E7DB5